MNGYVTKVTSQRHAYLVASDRVGTVVYEEMVVAVELQEVEAKHETLQDGMRLKGDDTVEVPLVLRLEHRPVYLPVQERQEVVLTQRRHVIWKKHPASETRIWITNSNV